MKVLLRRSWPGLVEWQAETLQSQLYRTTQAGNEFFDHLARLRPEQNAAREIYFLVLDERTALGLLPGVLALDAHRESPLSLIDIENMRRITQAGGIITPLAPGFYLKPRTVGDLVDFMAGKLLDLVGVPHNLAIRWDEQMDTLTTD